MCASATWQLDEPDHRSAYLASAIALFETLLARQLQGPQPQDERLAALLREAAKALVEQARFVLARWAELRSDPQAASEAWTAPLPPAPAVQETAAGVAMAVDYVRRLERHLQRPR